MRLVLCFVLALGAVVTLAAARPSRAPGPARAMPDSTLGLARSSVFSIPVPPEFVPRATGPGEGPRFPRAFPGAPPRVPHAIADFLPITREQNLCVECHDAPSAGAAGAVPLPVSHYRDLRRAPEAAREQIAGARYVCLSCHVPQTEAAPLVGNAFRP